MVLTRFALILLLLFLTGPTRSFAQTRATTQDGRPVILNTDGTWRYMDAPGAVTAERSVNATAFVQGARVPYKVWYDPAKWEPIKRKGPGEAEHILTHSKRDAYALVIAERIQVPLDKLKDVALAHTRNAAPDARLVSAAERVVNGARILNVQIDATVSGVPFTYYSYYYSGKQGTIQVVTYTSQNLFEEYKPDFIEFLAGLVIE